MRYSQVFNARMHMAFVRYVVWQYHRKSLRVARKHPDLFRPVSSELSRLHKALWSQLGVKSGDRWLRLHVNLTGIQDYTFCPEDIFFARIERILNDCNVSGFGVEDKNELWRYVPDGVEPHVVLRYVRGAFYDSESRWVSEATAQSLLDSIREDIVGKPCRSSGGAGVRLFRWQNGKHRDGSLLLTTDWIEAQGESYVVQHKVVQDKFSASFNTSSINTVRMMTLRQPWDGQVVVCRSMLRMGVSNAIVDNMMKGGLCVCVGSDGQLGRYAYDYDGERYESHPVSGLQFQGLVHPAYWDMVAMARHVAERIPYYNLLSFDLVPREDGTICVVEINATCQGITQLQYDFGGLFGRTSERLMDWCKEHQGLATFKHIRTFY